MTTPTTPTASPGSLWRKSAAEKQAERTTTYLLMSIRNWIRAFVVPAGLPRL